MLSESESVMCARFCPFFRSSRSISWGLVFVRSCCGEVGSVVVPVEGELKVVAVCSVCGVTLGSGSVMSRSWAVFSVFSSFWLLGSGGEKWVVGHNHGTCPWPLHFQREWPISLHSLQMGCWLLWIILHHSLPILIE